MPYKCTKDDENVIPAEQAVAETTFCHSEFISGSHNLLFLLDAETSSA